METKDNIIKWGIIGCGNVTEVKTGQAFNLVANSKLVAVMRRNIHKVKDYAIRHNVPYYFTDANELINHPDVNAIYIATPPCFHEEYSIAAMNAGKHVYIEKPMSTKLDSCIKMKEISDSLNIKLVIAHYRRFLPMFLYIKSLIQDNKIGAIRMVNINLLRSLNDKDIKPLEVGEELNWRLISNISGGGYFYDLAPHQLDLLFYLLDTKALMYNGFSINQSSYINGGSYKGEYDVEDVVVGHALLDNNIVFNGNWCFNVNKGYEKDEFTIYGSLGTIKFAVFGNEVTLLQDKKQDEVTKFIHNEHIQQDFIGKMVIYFLDKTNKIVNPCSANEAIQSMELMEQFVYGGNK